jgi:hypothetical protein
MAFRERRRSLDETAGGKSPSVCEYYIPLQTDEVSETDISCALKEVGFDEVRVKLVRGGDSLWLTLRDVRGQPGKNSLELFHPVSASAHSAIRGRSNGVTQGPPFWLFHF